MREFGFLLVFLLIIRSPPSSGFPLYDVPLYDSTAYTECMGKPERALYNGGILKGVESKATIIASSFAKDSSNGVFVPSFVLHNLTQATFYCFSIWVKIEGAVSTLVRATLQTEHTTYECIGTVLAKSGCWSFLKGGFLLDSPSNSSILFFQNPDGRDISIEVANPSLQPFTSDQWRINQQYIINTRRKRAVMIHVSNKNGERLKGADVAVEQILKDFPFGSAIAATILGNLPYQKWFVKRFNAAVFENELKWYATEPEQGKLNYTIADKMLKFVRANQIIARGHNIFWEDPKYTPPWHLGPNATLHFFETAHKADPLATLYMNDYNVVETCTDVNSTVDAYISKLKELRKAGMLMDGIGLESHFAVPNPPLIRGVLDKLATLELPIWLTEVDISKTLNQSTQAMFLEQVLREGYSHPSVNGIMLWTAFHPNGCYQMCLTNSDFQNLPAGSVVDKLLREWQTGYIDGVSDDHGSYSFHGFLGEYRISVRYGNKTANSTFSLCSSEETRHLNIQL